MLAKTQSDQKRHFESPNPINSWGGVVLFTVTVGASLRVELEDHTFGFGSTRYKRGRLWLFSMIAFIHLFTQCQATAIKPGIANKELSEKKFCLSSCSHVSG